MKLGAIYKNLPVYIHTDIYTYIYRERDTSNINKRVIFKNCAPFNDCISKIIQK